MDPVKLLHMANVYRHEYSAAREVGLAEEDAHAGAQVAADAAGVEWDRCHQDESPLAPDDSSV
jgi:uroporphyrinogen-III decarboxylase